MESYNQRYNQMKKLRDINNYKFKAIFISLKLIVIYVSIII